MFLLYYKHSPAIIFIPGEIKIKDNKVSRVVKKIFNFVGMK